jgi:hypothetical protein
MITQRVGAAALRRRELALVSSQRPTGFLDLPYEIRLQIYRHCLPQRTLFDVSPLLNPSYRFIVHDLPSHDVGYQELGDESPSLLLEDDQLEPFESAYDSPNPDLECLDLEDENQSHPPDEDQLDLFKSGIGGFRSRRSVLPGLLQVSRQVSDEALNVLYGDNAFKIILHGGGEYHLKTIFCEANRRRIRHIMLVLRPMGVSYCPNFRMDTAMWDTILPHLRTLGIVAEQPLEGDHYWNGRTFMEKMKEWIEWLTPILECLAKTLSTKSAVLVDVDEREETGKLIQKYLLHGYQQTRTKTGDFVFKRGEFSVESGYWDDDDGPFSCRDIYDYDSD